MASLAQMKAEAQKQGAQAPPDYPGGPDAWVADWYSNAKAAGSIESERPANYAGPNDAEAQGYNYSQNVAGPSGWQQGQGISPQQLRKLSAEQGWSEDFNRYSDAQLQAWIDNSWDPQSGRFRSEGGGGALVEKPTECPEGTTLHGSKCVSWDQLPFELGGSATGGPARGGGGAPGAPGATTPGDPLQQGLVDLYRERGGMFAGHGGFGDELSSGGIFWGNPAGGAVNPALAQAALTAFTPAAPSQNQPPPQPAAPPGGGMQAQPGGVPGMIASSFAGGMKTMNPSIQPVGVQQPAPMPAGAQSGNGALEASLAKKFKSADDWWASGPQVR